MSDQGFLLGKLKLEGIAQEVPQCSFDLFCFRFWASKAKEGVIGRPHILEPSEVRIVRISGREWTKLAFDLVSLYVVSLFFERDDSVLDMLVCGIDLSTFSPRVGGEQIFLDVVIQLIQGRYWQAVVKPHPPEGNHCKWRGSATLPNSQPE